MKFIVSGLANELSISNTERDIESIQNIAASLQPNEHMYIEEISERGRLAVWGVSSNIVLLEVQYTACRFEIEIEKTKIKEYFSDVVNLVNKPEKYGLLRYE